MKALAFLNAVGAVLAAFLGVRLLVTPAENRAAAFAFAVFTFFAAVFLGEVALVTGAPTLDAAWWHDLAAICIPAIAPAFYLYTRALTDPEFRWQPGLLRHFAVSGALLLLQASLWLMPASAGEVTNPDAERRAQLIYFAIIDPWLVIYMTFAWRRVWRCRRLLAERAGEGCSHPPRDFLAFTSLLWTSVVVSGVADFTPWGLGGTLVAGLGGVIGVFMLLWNFTLPTRLTGGRIPAIAPAKEPVPEVNAIGQVPVPSEVPVTKPVPPIEPKVPPATKTAAAGLKPDEAARLSEKLRRALEEERLFLAADLSLAALAEHIGTTRHKLSQSFRKTYGATFHQVVGRLRVRHAAAILRSAEGKVQTIAAIAEASGFNTLSAFNAAFRSEFGMSPSEFRGATDEPRLAAG